MSVDFVILGAGGFGREVLQHALDARADGGTGRVVGFLDDRSDALVRHDLTVGVVGMTTDPRWLASNVVIAVGDPRVRRQFRDSVRRHGGRLVSVVHPSAYVASSAVIGEGCVVGPGTYVGVDAVVGANVVLNVYASAGHDSSVGDDSVLSSYTAVTGASCLGSGVFTGTHATVAPGVSIGRWSKLSAGAVALRDCEAGSLVVGNPARSRAMFPDLGD